MTRPCVELHEGDNLLVMQRLLAADVRAHLAYLDPPFFTQRDFTYEPLDGSAPAPAYSDRWASLDDYLRALRDRVVLVRELLTRDGCMFLHVDPSVSHYVKVMLDAVFRRACFANEIIWRYRRWPVAGPRFQWMHDVILRYVREPSETARWNQLYEPLAHSTVETWGTGRQAAVVEGGRRVRSKAGEDASPGAPMGDVWDIPVVAPSGNERTGYPTQKPEALLERMVRSSSFEGDIVLDPYAGSGTSGVVAERLKRSWIGIDASPVAVQVAEARLRDARFGVKSREAAGPQMTLGAAGGPRC